MSNTATIGQGDTFACTFSWTPGETGPANLLATTLTSSIENRCGTTKYDLTVTKALDGLSFTVTYPPGTSDWEVGPYNWDIKFVFPTGTSHCQTFRINVIDTVTA
jgi:hypothetical protein